MRSRGRQREEQDAKKRRDPYEVLGARPDPEGIEIIKKGLVPSSAEKILRGLKKAVNPPDED